MTLDALLSSSPVPAGSIILGGLAASSGIATCGPEKCSAPAAPAALSPVTAPQDILGVPDFGVSVFGNAAGGASRPSQAATRPAHSPPAAEPAAKRRDLKSGHLKSPAAASPCPPTSLTKGPGAGGKATPKVKARGRPKADIAMKIKAELQAFSDVPLAATDPAFRKYFGDEHGAKLRQLKDLQKNLEVTIGVTEDVEIYDQFILDRKRVHAMIELSTAYVRCGGADCLQFLQVYTEAAIMRTPMPNSFDEDSKCKRCPCIMPRLAPIANGLI